MDNPKIHELDNNGSGLTNDNDNYFEFSNDEDLVHSESNPDPTSPDSSTSLVLTHDKHYNHKPNNTSNNTSNKKSFNVKPLNSNTLVCSSSIILKPTTETSSKMSSSKLTSNMLSSNMLSSNMLLSNMLSSKYELDDKQKQYDTFVDLTEADVQINLRLLGDIKEYEKIMIIDGRWMQVDQRYGQFYRRWWTKDSRARTLQFIDHVINNAKENCNIAVSKVRNNEDKQDNMTKLLDLQALLSGSMTGLGRMKSTYGDDKHNRATIETYIARIRTFCDQDLKKAICSIE